MAAASKTAPTQDLHLLRVLVRRKDFQYRFLIRQLASTIDVLSTMAAAPRRARLLAIIHRYVLVLLPDMRCQLMDSDANRSTTAKPTTAAASKTAQQQGHPTTYVLALS